MGDQLNIQHSWFGEVNPNTIYVLMEIRQETDYCSHHIQKVVAFFLAMRAFAEELRSRGHTVIYLTLDDPQNLQKIPENLNRILLEHQISLFEYQLPDEYRVDLLLREYCATLSIPFASVDSEHFLSTRTELAEHFAGKKTFLMEGFYRAMRKKHDLLMIDGKPVGGSWNFDHENRKRLPSGVKVPPPLEFRRNVADLLSMISRQGVKTIGTVESDNFIWPVTRAEAIQLLRHFCKHCLSQFGTYQDALTTEHRDLFHSRLSFALNVKLISPREVLDAAVTTWKKNSELISLPQIEGFVRQILGWREYMRGIYWAKMPEYEALNFFGHTAPLPGFYWDGKTKMRCVSHAIQQSLDWSYAHHIQRLMITGNFALLAGIHPDEVDQWYLGIYIDALQWVEITNTRGMSQYADGGIVGTKPYVSSANYIHKMSNYCSTCFYNRELRHGEKACPFNSLYWDFYHRHRGLLEKNPRIGHAYRVLDAMDPDERSKTLEQAAAYRARLDKL
jgi:deoxyribodipyrimidine photolyase-related protein